jgi:HlyD family secretion protein
LEEKMFREKALVKLKSPEQLDESLKVIPRKNRAAFRALMVGVVLALLWSVAGQVPENGRGQGILITPNSVVPLQAQGSGQVVQWLVSVGDDVEKGEVLGFLDQSAIQQELDQNIGKLAEIEDRNHTLSEMRDRFLELQRKSIGRKREMLSNRIAYLEDYIRKTRSTTEMLKTKNDEVLNAQRKNLLKAKEEAIVIEAELSKRLKSYERLRQEKLTPEESVRNMRRQYEDAKLKIRDTDLSIQDLALKEVQTQEAHLSARDLLATHENTLTSLNLQLRELDNTEAQLNKSYSEFKFQQENELHEVERNIERNRKELAINREIKSEYKGRVLELTASVGQLVTQGQRVAQIDTREASSELVALAYFQSKEGKQLAKGDQVRVSPSVVSQKQYGSIVGYIESISDYPVTAEAVVNSVGNSTVAERLLRGDYQIEVFVKLAPNTTNPSGYTWTSGRGPDVQITAGTLADVWVTVEQRVPVSYVLPLIRKWIGAL